MDEFTKEQRMQIIFNDIDGLLCNTSFRDEFIKNIKEMEANGQADIIKESETLLTMSGNGVTYSNKREIIKNFTDSFEKYGLIGTHVKTRNGQNPVPIIYATYIINLRSLGYETPNYEL